MYRTLLISLVLLSTAMTLAAAPPAMMRFGNGKPEPVLSYAWGVANASAMTAPQATMGEFRFAKYVTASSGSDFDACVTARHIPQVTFDLLDAKGKAVAQVKLTDVVVTSFTVSNADAPVESISLGYAHAEFVVVTY